MPVAPNANRDAHRINEAIRVPQVRLIDADGNMIGIVSRDDALNRAADAGLDLVEVAAQAEPPVCKLLDYGKFKYEAQKKAQEARKKHTTIEIKELKFRPNIDDNDYNVKMKHAVKFLTEGDKVKITMRFRGREVTHQDLGMRVLMRVSGDLAELGKVEQRPTLEGRQMTMVLAPLVQPGEKAEGADKAAEKA